jgi:hypothetical protein
MTNQKTIERRAREMEQMEREDDLRKKLAAERQRLFDYTHGLVKPRRPYNTANRPKKAQADPVPKTHPVTLLEGKLVTFN